jgi:hypothetical protein
LHVRIPVPLHADNYGFLCFVQEKPHFVKFHQSRFGFGYGLGSFFRYRVLPAYVDNGYVGHGYGKKEKAAWVTRGLSVLLYRARPSFRPF